MYEIGGAEVCQLEVPGVDVLATDGVFVLTGKEEGNL
jgi:hypothetical protein